MSCNLVYMKEGAKYCRPVLTKEEYLELRSKSTHLANLRLARQGNNAAKLRLQQFNYSLGASPQGEGAENLKLKAERKGVIEFPLKGADVVGNSVGMDIDQIIDVETILSKKDELGLLMMERSVSKGFHIVFKRHPEMTNEENLQWASDLLGVEYDKGAKDITRVFFATSNKEEDLIYLDEELFKEESIITPISIVENAEEKKEEKNENLEKVIPSNASLKAFDLCVKNAGLSPDSMDVWGEHNWHNNLMAVLSIGLPKLMTKEQLFAVVKERLKNYGTTDDCKKLLDFFYEKYSADKGYMTVALRDINAKAQSNEPISSQEKELDGENSNEEDFNINYYERLPKLPRGIKESVEAVGPKLAMPVITAVCPIIGALATGVRLDVHGIMKNLNLISYVAGDFASGKGSIDPVVDAWCAEQKAQDRMYLQQEDEWRERKRAAKNKKEQPEEPKLPIRCLTLNNTVANLSERLKNTEGKHAISFTPEADTVAQRFKSAMSDFSVMLRQSYDGTSFEREARSADAVNVHIEKLLWNVIMCGTPDALYRVVSNYTDGFQSRIAIARTPDNTFAALEDSPYVLNERQAERIHHIAHLLTLMNGEVVLPKLEETGRKWLEEIREETLKNDDKVKARQRFRVCVTAQRMTCCIMLCRVCEILIHKYGVNGAETRMKQNPELWKEALSKVQNSEMLGVFDVLADSLLENALYFFRDRIENAFTSSNYVGSLAGNNRTRRSKNDNIYERLDNQFTFEQAMQQAIAIKGNNVSKNSVHQMLKNWKYQGLIFTDANKKINKCCH